MTTVSSPPAAAGTGKKGKLSSAAYYLLDVFGRIWLAACVAVVLVIAWGLAVPILNLPSYLIPSPLAVVQALGDNWHDLLDAALVTGKEVLVGYALAVIIGVPLGTVLGESTVAQRALYPLMVIAQIVPKVSLAPLMIVWFGLGLSSKVIFIILISFFPIVVNTMVGIAAASSDLRRLAVSVGFGRFATFVKVTLPQAMPSVFAGLKISMTLGVIGAIVAEFVSAQFGLGYMILVAQGQLKTALLFAAIIVLTLLGLLFYGAVALLEKICLPWQEEGRQSA